MSKAQKFSASSSNFWANVLNTVLAVIAMAGVQLPTDPAIITADLTNTLTTSGWIAAVGLVALNILSPIYHAFARGSFSLVGILSSSNFWIQIGSLIASGLLLLGLSFPAGTVDQIVGAVYSKDWGTLAVILFTNVLNPLIRFFKDKFSAGQSVTA